METRSSDHKPMIVKLVKLDGENRKKCARGAFRFEANWVLEEDYHEVVCNAWGAGRSRQYGVRGVESRMSILSEKLQQCSVELKRWSRKKYGDADQAVRQLSAKLKILQTEETPNNLEEIRGLQEEIDHILEKEDVKWKQRAKLNWYTFGDRNTPYFHAWATHRRNTNKINAILDASGAECTSQEEISKAFTQYFTDLFSSGGMQGVEECLANVQPKVTDEMNFSLTREFTAMEVKEALDHMGPMKSPGPDGFAASFFQNSWDTVGEEVCRAALGFLNYNSFDPVINKTYIALIPKKKRNQLVS
jgi:hypothetical protein